MVSFIWLCRAQVDDPHKKDTMPTEAAAMSGLSFLIGEWTLDYTVTQQGRTTKTIRGAGSIQSRFDGTYLTFDYQATDSATGKTGGAHGIFAWDPAAGHYRYFWFESSGAFDQATGSLRDQDTLELDWQGSDCTQIFRRVDANSMYLEMRCPKLDLLLRVDFARLPNATPAM
jgi:hypothetical protein